jgi:catechol 2,3-dioxygenase-like lactoylglutathione lyase family enzyme
MARQERSGGAGKPGSRIEGMKLGIVGIDHILLAMPRGEEALARLFYVGVLGLREVSRPRALKMRGVWFVGPGFAVHLAGESRFRPAETAHPAFLVRDLEQTRRRLESAGVAIIEDASGLPLRRCYIHDPFGNRIELLDERDGGFTAKRPRR